MRRRSGIPASVHAPALDAALYGASALAALLVAAFASLERNRMWAELAWPAYAAGALVALALAVAAAGRRHERLQRARVLLALGMLAGAVVVPLAKEAQWRADGADIVSAALHPYAASEVVVTEGAAAALLEGRDPYHAYFGSPELEGRSPSIPQHFPYLPGMALFGLPGALVPNSPWTDARVFFALATGIAAVLALRRWHVPPERRLRALQVLVVLPTGASVLVAGGDDLPVLALSLLALVMFQRGAHLASAGAVAGAAMLKPTAWPLLLALAVAARGHGRRRVRSPLLLAPAVVAAGMLVAVVATRAAIVDDVLLFPAGLTELPSPASSPTVGALLTGVAGPSPLDGARVAVTMALLVIGLLVIVAVLTVLARGRAFGRAGAAEAATAAGLILLTLVVLAPVARVGYLLYPIDLLVWAVLLRPVAHATPAGLPSAVPEALAA